jgi:hypothetical protein
VFADVFFLCYAIPDKIVKTCNAESAATFEVMATAAKTLGVSGKLPGVQKVIRDELVKTVPTETDKPLTQDDRNTAAVVFESVQRAIQGVKP